MQRELDDRIKATGASNAYFPLFIPMDYLQREADHVEGFSPELAVVTHAGGKELEEPLVVRPTSETIFGEYMAKWVQSYRDLPLLLNQWCNIVRWEMRTRLFLRTTEFLWQEGHTAHASEEDARLFATRNLHDAYEDFMVQVLAIPVYVGRKTSSERFPGAINSMTCEGMMRDGKALQMGTSHELGQNFARIFAIQYLDDAGAQQLCWTTSWGASTRLMGALIMGHGDENGLVVPPRLAPTQCVVLLVKDEGGAGDVAQKLADDLRARGVRAELDARVDLSFGRRATDWELKGVPLRLEVGPRDLAEGDVTIVRRDTGMKAQVNVDAAASQITGAVDTVQAELLAAATSWRDEHTADCKTLGEIVEASATGFARSPWGVIGEEGESRLAESAVTVRCLQRADGSVPLSDDEPDLVAYCARSY
jgi:prolyl-tRNA synthetase